jgi:hypothetical protein
MDWTPLITVGSSLLGLGVGALGGWFSVQGKILQMNAQKKLDKAQMEAEIQAAQNAVIVRQKIGQIAAGSVEDTNRYDPPEVKKKLAMELAQQLAGEASTPSTDAQLLPNIQAGVAALPATRTGLPPNSTTTTTTVVSSAPSVPSGTTIDETVAKG